MNITDIIVTPKGELDFTQDAIDTLFFYMQALGLPIIEENIEEISYNRYYNCVKHLYLTHVLPLADGEDYFKDAYGEDVDELYQEWLSYYTATPIDKFDCWNWTEVIQDILFSEMYSEYWYELAKAIGSPDYKLEYCWKIKEEYKNSELENAVSLCLKLHNYECFIYLVENGSEYLELPDFATLYTDGKYYDIILNKETFKLISDNKCTMISEL